MKLVTNNEEDRDVKEQMAARYQERVSMGYTMPGSTQDTAPGVRRTNEDIYTLLTPARPRLSSNEARVGNKGSLFAHNLHSEILDQQSSSHNNIYADCADNPLDNRSNAKQEASTESRKAMMKELIEKFEADKKGRSEAGPTTSFASKKGDSESKLITSESSVPFLKSETCTSETKNKSMTASSFSRMTTSSSESRGAPRRPGHPVGGIKPAFQAKRYLLRQMGPSSSGDDATSAATTGAMPPTRVVLRGHTRRKSPVPPNRGEKFSKLLSTSRETSSEVCTPFTRASVKKKVSMSSINSSQTPQSSLTTPKNSNAGSKGKDCQPGISTPGSQQPSQERQQQHPLKTRNNTMPIQPTPQKRQLKEQQQQQSQQEELSQQKEEQIQEKQQTKSSDSTEQQSPQQQQSESHQQEQDHPSPLERKLIHRKIRRRSSADNPTPKRSTTAMERYLRFLKNSSPSPSGNLSSVDTDIGSNTTNLLPDSKDIFTISGHSTPCNYTQELFNAEKVINGAKPEVELSASQEKQTSLKHTMDLPTSPPSNHKRNVVAIESFISDIYKDKDELEVAHELSPWSPNEAHQQQLRDIVLLNKSKGERTKSPRQGSSKSQRGLAKKGIKALIQRSNSLVNEKGLQQYYQKLDAGMSSTTSSNTRTATSLSPKQRDEQKQEKVSKLLSRYEEAKTVLQQHQLSRKSSDRRTISFPCADTNHTDVTDNLLLTQDQLADTNLVPVHLRQRRFYTSPSAVSDESLGMAENNIFDFLSGLSSSEEEDSSYMSISERLKQIKANRLLRKGKDPDSEKKLHDEDSLVNLLSNLVEVVGKRERDNERSATKRSRKGSSSSPKTHSPTLEEIRYVEGEMVGTGLHKYFSTPDNECAKLGTKSKHHRKGSSKDPMGWDSPGFKVSETLSEHVTSSSPRSNGLTEVDMNSLTKPAITFYCDANSEQNVEGASLYSSCTSIKRMNTLDKMTTADSEVMRSTPESSSRRRRGRSHSSLSEKEDPRFLLDEDFLILLEQNPALTSSGSSLELRQMFLRGDHPGHKFPKTNMKAQLAKSKRKAEKREKAKRKPKKKIAEETKVKTPKKTNRENSDASSRSTYLKRGVSPKKITSSKAEIENKGSSVSFARQDSKIRNRPKSKQERSPTRLPLRQVKSNIYPKNQDSSVATTIRCNNIGKVDHNSVMKSSDRISPPKRAKVSTSPVGVRSSRHNSPGTKLKYQDPEAPELEIKMPPINRALRPPTGPTQRWPMRSRIPVLVTMPRENRHKKEVLVQFRRSLKTGIALTESFKKKLKAAAHQEWTMHKWTMPLHSCDESDTYEEETISCEVNEVKHPKDVIPLKRRLNRLHGICLGVWLTMAGIVHLGTQLYTCNGEDYDYYCKNDDLQCILPPVF